MCRGVQGGAGEGCSNAADGKVNVVVFASGTAAPQQLQHRWDAARGIFQVYQQLSILS